MTELQVEQKGPGRRSGEGQGCQGDAGCMG